MISTLLIIPVIIYLIWKFSNKNNETNLPPGPPQLPVLGNALQITPSRLSEDLAKYASEYGRITLIDLAGTRIISLNTIETMKEAFLQNGDNFSARPVIDAFAAYTDNGIFGLISTQGQKWREHRRHALHVLRDFGMGRSFQEAKIEIEVQAMIKHLDFVSQQNGGDLDPISSVKYAVVNIINNMLFGFRFEYGDPEFDMLQFRVQENFAELFKVMPLGFVPGSAYLRSILPYLFPKAAENVSHFKKFFGEQIQKHDATYEDDKAANNGQSSDYVYAFIGKMKEYKGNNVLPNGETVFTHTDLIYNLLDLFVAGFETTATSISWFLVYMARYPEVQAKIVHEMKSEIGDRPSWSDRPRLRYTQAVLMELQRCANIAPMGVFHSSYETCQISGFTIPPGCLVVANLTSIMSDPEKFPEPQTFSPERFLDPKTGEILQNDAVVPFSIGKRACLGEGLARMELFMFATALLWHYKILPPTSSDGPTLKAVVNFTRAPEPFQIRLEERQ